MQKSAAGSHQAGQDELSRGQLASYPAGSQPSGAMMRSQIPQVEGPVTADVAVQSGKGKEKGKRESEVHESNIDTISVDPTVDCNFELYFCSSNQSWLDSARKMRR